MSGRLVAAGCLAMAAAVIAAPTPPGRRRLRRLGPGHGLGRGPGHGRGQRLVRDHRLGAVLGGISVALVVGGWAGLAGGLLTALVLDRLLRRLEPRAARAERARAAADLPLAADLLAGALRAGAPVDRTAQAVGEALGGPLGERLGRVSRALRLGASPEEAWRHLSDVAGADRLSGAVVRSSVSGAAVASALARVADDLRAARLVDQDAAARRASVLIVLPLGLCFLPAFVLAGLVPVVVAVLRDLL